MIQIEPGNNIFTRRIFPQSIAFLIFVARHKVSPQNVSLHFYLVSSLSRTCWTKRTSDGSVCGKQSYTVEGKEYTDYEELWIYKRIKPFITTLFSNATIDLYEGTVSFIQNTDF